MKEHSYHDDVKIRGNALQRVITKIIWQFSLKIDENFYINKNFNFIHLYIIAFFIQF